MWRLIMVVGAAWALTAAAPGNATAANTVIGFDDLADGTTVDTQYSALQGVQFDTTADLPVVRQVGALAQSPPNVANISVCSACEFFVPATDGHFSDAKTRQHLSVRVGEFGPGPDQAVLTLTAYDVAHNVVAQSPATTVTAGAGFHTLLSADSAQPNIYAFEISARPNLDDNKQIGIDDLTFDNPTSGATPDFALTVPSGVTVLDGSSASVPVSIDRVSGSSGNVSLSIAGLPPGVTASFVPNPAGGSVSTLTLTAAPDAGRGVSAATMTGTPADASVGPGAHSAQIAIDVEPNFSVGVSGSSDVDLTSCLVRIPIVVTRDLRFTDPVNLSVSGLPSGVSASFSPAMLTFPGGAAAQTSTLTMQAQQSGVAIPPSNVTVNATSPGHPSSSTTLTVHGTCPAAFDVQVQSVQATQGIQTTYLPQPVFSGFRGAFYYYDPFTSPLGDSVAHLEAGGKTIVRVFADARFAPPGGVPNVDAELYGTTADGAPLPGSPLLPDWGPRRLQQGPDVPTDAVVASPGGAYTFTLPDSWTHDLFITLRAVVNPPQPGTTAVSVRECATPACQANNSFELRDVHFNAAPEVGILPILFHINGRADPTDVGAVFDELLNLTPLHVDILPYQATIDASDIAAKYSDQSDQANYAVLDRVDNWDDDNCCFANGYTIGVNVSLARGVEHTHYDWGDAAFLKDAVVDSNRPLTSVPHEFFHILGLPHAGHCDPANADDSDWPPDQKGYIQGVGLDRHDGSGGATGPYRILDPSSAFQYYDLMSYCASEASAWVSLHNWDQLLPLASHASADPKPAAGVSTSVAAGLRVRAVLTPTGATVLDVDPRSAPAIPVSGSPYHLVVRDAGGRVLSDSLMQATESHVDPTGEVTFLEGAGASVGAARVEIVRAGLVLGSRVRGPHAPEVRVLSPRRGGTLGGRRPVVLHWVASSADHSPLITTVEYSSDDGRTWRAVFIGPNRDLVVLPSRYLAFSRRARVRIRVNDGFNETVTTSIRFTALGAPPVVRILSPSPGTRVMDDASLYLSGQAFDDASRPLTGTRLRWFAGSRLIGTGEQISPSGLPPGMQRIRLLARDARGRTASASLVIAVHGARPLFLLLHAPRHLSAHAPSLRLRVASSLPATLTAAGQRFAVGRKARAISVRVRPGGHTLRLNLRLTAYGQATLAKLTISRS
jgi:hypothetical protein